MDGAGKVGDGGDYEGVSQREDAWDQEDWDEGWPEDDQEEVDVFGTTPIESVATSSSSLNNQSADFNDDDEDDGKDMGKHGGEENVLRTDSIKVDLPPVKMSGGKAGVEQNFKMLDAMLPRSTSRERPKKVPEKAKKAGGRKQSSGEKKEDEVDMFAALGIVPDVTFSKPSVSPTHTTAANDSGLLAFVDDGDDDDAGAGAWGGAEELDFGDDYKSATGRN